jgi:hypothetical protein
MILPNGEIFSILNQLELGRRGGVNLQVMGMAG